MKQLTPIEKEILDEALLILQKSPEPIARHTLRVIETRKLNFLPFRYLTRTDWKKIMGSYNEDGHNLLSRRFPVTPKDVKTLHSDMQGLQLGKNIYLNFDKLSTELASTIVHEVNHYSRGENPYAVGPKTKFINESSAFLAEELLKGKRPSSPLFFAIGSQVNKSYKLNNDPSHLALATDSTLEIPKLELKMY